MDYAALVGEARAALDAGRLADAEPVLREIVRLNPREGFAWALLGLIRVRRGEPEAAYADVERALALERDNPDYLNLRGVVQGERGELSEAVATFRRALKRRPGHAETHYNLGKALLKQGQAAAAVESFRRAGALQPPYPDAPYMLGLALQTAGRAEDALRVIQDLAARLPESEDAFLQLGGALGEARGVDALIEHCRAGMTRWAQSGRLHRVLGVALLAAGRFDEGWSAYRGRDLDGPAPRERLPEPLPGDLSGRAFLLDTEQGIGDVLFFLRYAPELARRGASVVARVDPRLVAMLRRCDCLDDVAAADASLPAALESRERIAMGDLPFVAGAAPCAPLPLSPDPARTARWRERLAAFGPGPHVGVTWRAGSAGLAPEFARRGMGLGKEIALDSLGRSLRGVAGTVVALQRRPRPGEIDLLVRAAGRPVFDATAANEDLEEVLALLAVLDRYAAVSNANVHLRAGAGLPSDVLVPHPPEWRWMLAGEASPWFPGARVHRQDPDRKWDAALASLRASLEREALSLLPASPATP